MKKVFSKLFVCLAALIVLFGIFSLTGCASKNDKADYYRIVLMSDTHLPNKQFSNQNSAKQGKILEAKNKIIDDINGWKDVGEVAVLGDVVADVGNREEYDYAVKYFAKIHHPLAFIVGNHDYIYQDILGAGGKHIKGDAESRKAKLERFKQAFGLKELYYSQKVNNYLLIFLSADSLDSRYLTQISPEQLSWLRKTLKANSAMPTIIFFHAPLTGTLSNYNKQVNTASFVAQPAKELEEIIKANSQIMLWVSGHTHTPATNPDFASDKNLYGGKVFNVHNADINRETIWTNSLYLYRDRIVIKTFNHKTREWMGELERTLPIKPAG